MAFNNSLTIGSETFERLDDGKWILSTATADEPDYLILKNTIRPDSQSEYLIRRERYKNSATAGAGDDVASVHLVIKAPLKSFTQAQLEAILASLVTFLSTANVTKLLRGER